MRATTQDRVGTTLQVVASTNRRGAELFAQDLETALQSAGRRVRTVALAGGAGSNGLAVRALSTRGHRFTAYRRLRAEMRDSGLTVAHGAATLQACALASIARPDDFVYRSIGDPEYWVRTRSRRVRVGYSLRRARAVVALWPAAADALVQLHGIPRERVFVIPNGVSAGRFPLTDEAARARARERLRLGTGGPVVAYLGALSAEKNVAAAIAAVGAIPNASLVVAGDGPQRAELEVLAAEIAPTRIRFVGATDDPVAVLAAADALVLPSKTEGIPAALIEAGLTGIPVVATDVGGVREVVIHGETGFVVPQDDGRALTNALRDALAASGEFGLHARRHCLHNFEMQVVAGAWADLLDSLERI